MEYTKKRAAHRVHSTHLSICESETVISDGVTVDLSIIGAKYISRQGFKSGEIVNFQIVIKESDSMETLLPLEAEIVWSEEVKDLYGNVSYCHTGIKFKPMDAMYIGMLKNVIPGFNEDANC